MVRYLKFRVDSDRDQSILVHFEAHLLWKAFKLAELLITLGHRIQCVQKYLYHWNMYHTFVGQPIHILALFSTKISINKDYLFRNLVLSKTEHPVGSEKVAALPLLLLKKAFDGHFSFSFSTVFSVFLLYFICIPNHSVKRWRYHRISMLCHTIMSFLLKLNSVILKERCQSSTNLEVPMGETL